MSLLMKGVKDFISLTDTPEAYAGKPLKVARVKQTADGMEFADAITQYEIPTNISPDQVTQEYYGGIAGYFSHRMRVSGHYAISAGNHGLSGEIEIVDVSNVENPIALGDLDPCNNVTDVFISGKYLYVTSGSQTKLVVVDWSNPRAPSVVATLTDANIDKPYAVFVRGRYAYLACNGGAALAVVDISTPSNPRYIAKYSSVANLDTPLDVIVSGNYAFVLSMPNLTCINIADPTNPTYVGKVAVIAVGGSYRGRMAKFGKYIYVTDYNTDQVRIVDVSNPASMTILGTVTDATYLASVQDLAVVGDWIFAVSGRLSTSGYLVIIDARDKTLPSIHETIDLTKGAGSIAIAGKYLFIGSGYNSSNFWVFTPWSIDIPAFIGNSIFADYIFCERLDVAEQITGGPATLDGMGIPDALPKVLSTSLVLTQVVAAAPDTAYVELSALYRTNIDFSKLAVKQARVIISGIGNEVTAGKGIEIYNSTDAAAICEATWDGNAQQNGLAGTWTDCNLRAAKDIQVRVKGSSGTEDITVDKVELQVLFD